MEDIKNKISNWVAYIVTIGTIIATALDSVPEGAKWYVWVGAVAIAIIAYLTGKQPDLKKPN